MVHIVVVGNGRIGRPTAYTLFNERLADEISLVDIKPGQAWAFGEELRHVAASLKYDIKINTYDRDDGPEDADLVVICVGKPRLSGVKMDRRDLVAENAVIVNTLAEVMPPSNPRAKWVIVSNPVDAMATLFKKVSGASFVISTGDHPDTLRFRTKIALDLGVPISKVEGFVGGEHGSLAFPLWSTVKIEGEPLEDYLSNTGKRLDREASVKYVRGISKQIVDIIGGTEVGPAAGFRDIIRSILQNRKEIYSCADSLSLPSLSEAVNVSVPIHVGERLGQNLWGELTDEEHRDILEAAKAILDNYIIGMESIDNG